MTAFPLSTLNSVWRTEGESDRELITVNKRESHEQRGLGGGSVCCLPLKGKRPTHWVWRMRGWGRRAGRNSRGKLEGNIKSWQASKGSPVALSPLFSSHKFIWIGISSHHHGEFCNWRIFIPETLMTLETKRRSTLNQGFIQVDIWLSTVGIPHEGAWIKWLMTSSVWAVTSKSRLWITLERDFQPNLDILWMFWKLSG